jgi:hypothetical protein
MAETITAKDVASVLAEAVELLQLADPVAFQRAVAGLLSAGFGKTAEQTAAIVEVGDRAAKAVALRKELDKFRQKRAAVFSELQDRQHKQYAEDIGPLDQQIAAMEAELGDLQ